MSDLMTFPETWEEFERSYGFTDTDEVYTNGSRLIQSFRVKQWLEHIQTVDAVEIVRCKDCKYWHEDVANFIAITSIPRGACKVIRGLTNGEFFCAEGERKTDADIG